MNKISYVGMDVHKKNIIVAKSLAGGEAELIGEYPNTDQGVKKLIKKLKEISREQEVKICYEAGSCGFALKRILDNRKFVCEIAAPSLIPTKKGDRIKTDKRDAKKLARLFRSNELTFISVPDEEKEAVRDLVRCREDLMINLKKTKQRVNHFLIRHGYCYGGSNWTKSHLEWIKKIEFDNRTLTIVLENYLNEIESLGIQINDLDKEIEQIALTDEYKDKVKALCAFRGIQTLTAMVLISEIVDFNRFSNPRELMAYIGMVPAEDSSGGRIKKGSITKCGNRRVRRVLIEASHHYRHKPIISTRMKKDLENTTLELRQAPLKAMKRLHKRYYALIFRGKETQKAVVAIARELLGFIWHNMLILENRITV